MESRQQPPAWAAEYLRFDGWTQDEFRNLLCGLRPVRPLDAPPRTRQQTTDDYTRDELRRFVADRHVRDAVNAGQLAVSHPPDERLLEKVRPHVTTEDLEALRRAIAHDRACSKAYHVSPHSAIRWAASRRDRFPDFPFTLEDLAVTGVAVLEPSKTVAPADDATAAPAAAPEEADADRAGVRPPEQGNEGRFSSVPLPRFPNRARWLERELGDRKWTYRELEAHNGPSSKTSRKILEGRPVRETALMKTVQALSDLRPVSRRDIPND